MPEEKIKIYTSQRMTGRECAELVAEADVLCRTIVNYGFVPLNPVVEEKVKPVHEILKASEDRLVEYWKRDKEMIREADVVLDYQTLNASDGTNKEIAYARWCLWKPVVRVWKGPGGLISRLEDDLVVPSLYLALDLIKDKWGTYEKLREWRQAMWHRSFNKWFDHQRELRNRYNMDFQNYTETFRA